MTEPARSAPRTAAALAARHRDTQAALSRVRDTIARLRREKTPVSVAAVARRAGVSRTFLYTNPDAKTAVAEAIRESGDQRSRLLAEADDAREATWRERALNAEDALKAAHAEIYGQRARIGEILGRIRDLEAKWTQDDVQRITSENTTLKQRVRQLSTDNRALDERLTAARSNLRFQDRRIADLEVRLTESANPDLSANAQSETAHRTSASTVPQRGQRRGSGRTPAEIMALDHSPQHCSATIYPAICEARNIASRTTMANLSPFRGPRARAQFIATYDSLMRSWPVPFAERDVETAYGRTHLVVSGPPSAPPLVLLHAASATSAMWSPIIAATSSSYRCYCIDTITEANKSVATKRIYSVADHVDWLRQVFAALDLASARVMGLSYGGWLAAQLALHAPERVSQLVLLTPAGTLAPLPLQWWVKMMTPVVLRSPRGVSRFLQWMSSTPDASTDPSVNLIAVSMLSCRLRRVTPPSVFTDDQLRRITMPVAVVIGDRDVIYRGGPEAALARAKKLIPNVRTQLLPGANHLLTLDCPEPLITEVSAALA